MEFDKNHFGTPWDFYNRCHEEFRFTVDACATKENAKHRRFITEEENALSMTLKNQRIWLNPPYQDRRYPLESWVSWCVKQASMHNSVVIALIQSSTDTNYWHDFIINEAAEVRNIRGRIWFLENGVQKKQTRHLNSLIVWRPGVRGNPGLTSMRARV